MREKRRDAIFRELKHHLPFSFGSSLIAGVMVAAFYLIGKIPSRDLFEYLHPAHVLVSAIATATIYWKYGDTKIGNRWSAIGGKATQTILVGMFGAILIGSLSDIILPWIAGNLFSLQTSFHLPILEEPLLILGVALAGSVLGMYYDLFRVSHVLHVFLSVFASLFYLLAFSIEINAFGILLISGLVFLTVYIPCCISDIVFPLLFLKRPCVECGHWHEGEK